MVYTVQEKAEQEAGTGALELEGEENPERGNWSGKLDFLLSCIGYAVGRGSSALRFRTRV